MAIIYQIANCDVLYQLYMSGLFPKELLLDQLKSICCRSLSISQALNILQKETQIPGYCIILMEIAGELNIDISIRQIALQLLSAHLDFYWYSQLFLNPQQKEHIKNRIIDYFFIFSLEQIKPLQDILTKIIQNQYMRWLPTQIVLTHIHKVSYQPQIVSILQSIQNGLLKIKKIKAILLPNFYVETLPPLLELVSNSKNYQAILICLKIYHKAVVEYETTIDVQKLLFSWMPIVQKFAKSTHKQQINSANIDNVSINSLECWSLELKKISTLIYYQYIQIRAERILQNNSDNTSFHQKWYKDYGDNFYHFLVEQFFIDTPKQIKIYYLQCVLALTKQKRLILLKNQAQFQYNILQRYLLQNLQGQCTANPRYLATEIWRFYFKLGYKLHANGQQLYDLFYDNMNYLKNKLEGRQEDIKIALHLLQSLSQQITQFQVQKEVIINLFNKHVISMLTNQNQIIKKKAIDVISIYQKIYDVIQINKVLQVILPILLSNQQKSIFVKAAYLFLKMYGHQQIQKMVEPQINQVVKTYISLISVQFWSHQFAYMKNSIVKKLALFAYEAVNAIADTYIKLSMNTKLKDDDDAKQSIILLIEIACRIVQKSQPSQIYQIKSLIANIVLYSLTNNLPQYLFQWSLELLQIYICKIKFMSKELWAIYDIIVFYIYGRITGNWSHYQSLQSTFQFNQHSKIEQRRQDRYFDPLLPILRIFFQAISANLQNQQSLSKFTFFIFQLSKQVFLQAQQLNYFNLQAFTSLLTNFLEHFQHSLPQSFYVQIWQYLRRNLKESRFIFLSNQLLGALIWAAPSITLKIARRQNMHELLIAKFIQAGQEQDTCEFVRAYMILGLNSILSLAQSQQRWFEDYRRQIPVLFRCCYRLVARNSESYLTHQERPENSIKYHYDQITEKYDFYYLNNIRLVNQIEQFQLIINRIQSKDNHLYQAFMLAIQADQLDTQIIQEQINRAIIFRRTLIKAQ